MFGHSRAALAASLLALAAPAAARAATVNLRIEGSGSTIYEGPVRTDARAIDGGDGSGPHACQGTDPSAPRPTPTTALADAAAGAEFAWHATWTPDFNDFFIDSIGEDASHPPDGYWAILADGWLTAGGCSETVREAQEVVFAYGSAHDVLELAGPVRVDRGQRFSVNVRNWRADDDGVRHTPVSGATVDGATTGADGEAEVQFDQAGWRVLKATRAGAVRSNALVVCVAPCDEPAPTPPAGTPLPAPVDGSTDPARVTAGLRVRWPRDRRLTRGRLLHGIRLTARAARPARLTAELWTAGGNVRLGRASTGYVAGSRTLFIRPVAKRVPEWRRFTVTIRVTARTRKGVATSTRRRIRVAA